MSEPIWDDISLVKHNFASTKHDVITASDTTTVVYVLEVKGHVKTKLHKGEILLS